MRRVCARLLVAVLACAALSGEALVAAEADDIDEKLNSAKEHFAREKQADTYWYYGWLSFSSAILATSTTIYFTAEKDSRIQRVQPVSMAVSGIGVATLIMFKPKSFSAQAELLQMGEETLEQKKAKLRRSEEWLAISAERQRFTTGLFAQVSTISFLGAAALIDAIWINGPWWGLLRFVTSLAVAEFKIFTQPTYSRDRYDSQNRETPVSWDLRMTPGEVAIVLSF